VSKRSKKVAGEMDNVLSTITEPIKGLLDALTGFVSRQDSLDCPKKCCAFLTDVEGNYEYFERYVEISKVLTWADEKKNSLILKEGTTFVFGGDSQDKGIGDIRFVKILLDLKERYPDRVVFIMGNRDANKLRFTTELSDEALKSNKVRTDLEFPYWIPKDKVVTPQKFYDDNNLQDTPANRLKWLLK
jgi:hypothetical protein